MSNHKDPSHSGNTRTPVSGSRGMGLGLGRISNLNAKAGIFGRKLSDRQGFENVPVTTEGDDTHKANETEPLNQRLEKKKQVIHLHSMYHPNQINQKAQDLNEEEGMEDDFEM